MSIILQPRDITLLEYFARYFMLTSRQVRELVFTDDKTNRVTRRRLGQLTRAGYLRKRNMSVVHPTDGSATPVYHLDRAGRQFIAEHTGDDTLLLKPIEPSQPQHLYHYAAVAETHRVIDRAVEQTTEPVTIDQWYNEDEVINPDVEHARERKRLRTEFSESPKVVCLPDAAFLIDYHGHRIAVYLEQDRDTFFHKRVAARKNRGYEALLASRRHREHFPNTTVDYFYVLFVAPTRRRADNLCSAFAKLNEGNDAALIYRFASLDEINETNLLFEPVLTRCHDDERVSLIRRMAEPATQP